MNRFVVVGVDPSTRSRAAVDWAVDEAFRRRADLRLVHAFEAAQRQSAAAQNRRPGRCRPTCRRDAVLHGAHSPSAAAGQRSRRR
ncbi:universal stress protein [Kitasatospora sp. NPDC059812]|uniref:universal stress protein n=1 Tax=unclassified Kitasatospora TaxID=2633591 RepID=UPI003647852E